jgi:ribosomal protein S18 acetylase RimI-like enzyme
MSMKRILSIQSHVVFGCAGNSAAVFPMRRLGVDVWPVKTVQFSNHTQYAQGWQGMAMPAGHISALAEGLGNIGVLGRCDAVLSGYLGSAEQGDEILKVVNAVKAANPDAIYFCDPVMGHPEKGCIVAPGVTRFLTEQALPVAISQLTWQRFLDPAEPMHALLAWRGGQLLGLAHYVFHRNTLMAHHACYLQDLFTVPAARGQGVARQLISAVLAAAQAAGSPSVYWHTRHDNAVARQLYDRVARDSGFIVYRHTF